MARREHLYRDGAEPSEERGFEERYGARKGRRVYGAVVGKVAREQAARRGGKKTERVKAHGAVSSTGKHFQVRAHDAEISADPEDDRPRHDGTEHDVRGFEREQDGKRVRVRPHRAKNPRG